MILYYLGYLFLIIWTILFVVISLFGIKKAFEYIEEADKRLNHNDDWLGIEVSFSVGLIVCITFVGLMTALVHIILLSKILGV